MTKTLHDYVQFECFEFTFDSARKAEKLEKAILAECEVGEDGKSILSTFVTAYVCTNGIVFHLDETARKPLHSFKKRWEALGKKPTPSQIWEFRTHTQLELINEWIKQFNDEQRLFDVPREELPIDMLTPEEREEAKKPNSFSPDSEEYAVLAS